MKIYSVNNQGELTLIGTVRIINDKLEFDLSEDDYFDVVGKAPVHELDPADFISYIKGRFAMQRGIATEDENEYDYGSLASRMKKRGAKYMEAHLDLAKDFQIPEDQIFTSEKRNKKK